MLFRSVAKCSAYGTNAMHCTSKHRRCDTTTALVREIPETLFVPTHAEDDIFIPERRSQPVNEPMTFLDFFSGVGGFRKGFELCGMVCKGHCEIDKFADRSYRAIHDVKEDEWYGEDITKTEPADLPRVNLWAGGFPCQDISVSGRQRGLAGKRSSLFFEIVRLLKGTPNEDRPEWLVLEMLKICSPLIADGTLRPFSIRWPKSAIISNTDCLIHASTAFRKTGNASTLSLIDILEPRVDEKYFLSPQATARLLYN